MLPASANLSLSLMGFTLLLIIVARDRYLKMFGLHWPSVTVCMKKMAEATIPMLTSAKASTYSTSSWHRMTFRYKLGILTTKIYLLYLIS